MQKKVPYRLKIFINNIQGPHYNALTIFHLIFCGHMISKVFRT